MTGRLKTQAVSFNLCAYQTFWTSVSPSVCERYRGKSVAVQLGEDGWRIIDGADSLEQLRDSLIAAGVDMDTVVLDRIPDDEQVDDWTGGVQLQ